MPNITISPTPEEKYYRQSRNVELSTLKFIEDNLAIDWSGVNIVKTWTQVEKVDNPVVCVYISDTLYTRNELGDTAFRDNYTIAIDVYATSDAMRLDLSDYIVDKLTPGWTYYVVSQTSGAPKTLVYTEGGRCSLDQILDNTRVNIGALGDVKDKYRQTIVISVRVGIS